MTFIAAVKLVISIELSTKAPFYRQKEQSGPKALQVRLKPQRFPSTDVTNNSGIRDTAF